MSDVWEGLYRQNPEGFRHYPNEELVRFLGRTYFHKTPFERRGEIRILEVGCGNGANLWAVAKEGFSAFGMDSAPRALAVGVQTLLKWGVRAHLSLGDARALSYRDESFEIVFDVGTLCCLRFSELADAYREIRRVLRSGGRFFSYHFGRDTWDYDHGGGRLIDKHTFDNIPNPDAIFPNLGTISMPEPEDVEGLLRQARLSGITIETVVKTYRNRSRQVQYLVIECEKG